MQKLGTIENCRSRAQIREMKRTILKGVCCFCHVDPEVNATLKETRHWKVIASAFPYPHTKAHVMIIPKKHWTKMSEVAGEAENDFFKILKWAEKSLIIPGGGMFVRIGNHSHSGGTITHMHFQIAVPTLRGPLIAVFAMAKNQKQAQMLAKKLVRKK